MVGVNGLTRNGHWSMVTVHMEQSTEQNHWKATLIAQGRSLKWLAQATDTNVRTVYAYSRGQNKATAAWLAKASAALGTEVSG